MKCRELFSYDKLILFINFGKYFSKEKNERNTEKDNQWGNRQANG
jgi:hypothetical protein